MTPLRSIRSDTIIHVFSGSGFYCLSGENISIAKIGPKAYGILTLPTSWYPPFFVIKKDSLKSLTKPTVLTGFKKLGISASQIETLIIRSNEYDESMLNRGKYESYICNISDIEEKLRDVSDLYSKENDCDYWIIQLYIKPEFQGHLSNERRVSRDRRDWVFEIESSDIDISINNKTSGNIAIRTWRNDSIPNDSPLICKYSAKYDEALKDVARWALQFKEKFHFEWLCDGKQVYVVQVDSEDKKKGGINPKSLVKTPKTLFDEHNLKVFRKATDLDFEKYAKLANTNIYRNIGYRIVDFYILDDHKLIADIAAGQNIPRELLEDLKSLTSRALVIRTDGSEIPENYQTMLPRSDELRSLDNALDWLRDSFITKINEVGIADSKLCLIAHHFLPATSSAWCLASPDSRKVRIESLWGIPEGLYWYAHDVFDVDTRVKEPSSSFLPKKNLIIKARTRYKEKFIAPNNEGNWVLHETDELSDWSSSISDFNINKKESSWVTEIAWNSRRIAKEAGKPVVIMWFIDIPTELCNHSVIPWYHTSWEQKGAEYKKATPKHKDPNSSEYRIENEDDWQELHRGGSKLASISRVIVDPKEPELVRNQKFAEDLANFVIKHNLVVELSGGILSHAFYMLTKRGANVECKDLYATEDEELEFNKLVRDLIPENIIAGGEHVEVLALRNDALLASLKRKLVEESLEVFDAETTTEIREEIADLREVVDRLAEVLNISEEQIKETRAEKNEKRGNFSKGIMLTKTKLSPTMSKGEKERVFFEDIMDSELRIIEKIGELPYSPAKLNQDKRLKDDKAIKQLTFTIPLYSQNIDNLKGNLPFSNDSGVTLEVEVTVDVERNGSELKIKLNLTNAPKQLDLDIDQF